MFPKDKLERLVYRPPGKPALKSLATNPPLKRTANLTLLTAGLGMCAWCNRRPVQAGRRKYCSADCIFSAEIFCAPQSPQAKAYIFIEMQSCICGICKKDFTPDWLEILERQQARSSNWNAITREGYINRTLRIPYFMMGSLCGERWQVDHRIPIADGGQAIGLENMQVLCGLCHTKKTIAEAQARRLSRGRPMGDGGKLRPR